MNPQLQAYLDARSMARQAHLLALAVPMSVEGEARPLPLIKGTPAYRHFHSMRRRFESSARRYQKRADVLAQRLPGTREFWKPRPVVKGDAKIAKQYQAEATPALFR